MSPADRIEINPAVMMGKPVVRGTRVPIELIVKKVAQGASEQELLAAYPRLTADDIGTARTLYRICRDNSVRELAVFGSVLRNDFGPESDIDLLVEFQPSARVGMLGLARLRRELESMFGRAVDLVPKGGLKPAVRKEIGDRAQLLYAA